MMTIIILDRNRGKAWSTRESGGNTFREVELSSRDTAEFYFKELIAPPQSSLACLDFRFKKFSPGEEALCV